MEFTNYSQCLLHETTDDYFECYVTQENEEGLSMFQNEKYSQQQDNYTSYKSPFSKCSLIPLPNELEEFHSFGNQNFIRRRNERERTRVRNVNDGFERLRQHLPIEENRADKRLSKVETLRLAIDYIRNLEYLLLNHEQN